MVSKPKTSELADKALVLLQANTPVAEVKQTLAIDSDDNQWNRVSSLIYEKAKAEARKERDEHARQPHVSTTPNALIVDLIALNQQLGSYALLAPPTITTADYRSIKQLATELPASEDAIVACLSTIMMAPKVCAIMKQGFEHFPAFISFAPLVEAAILAYYQENYISSFLTLVPVVEGLILRWMGFDGTGPEPKPDFEAVRKFVGKSYLRQPNPGNVLFHEVYVKASQGILTNHLFQSSTVGLAHANFSRHLAAHLLSNGTFATQPNCIRLFILFDALLKVYTYETKPAKDPRFDVDEPVLQQDVQRYLRLLMQRQLFRSSW